MSSKNIQYDGIFHEYCSLFLLLRKFLYKTQPWEEENFGQPKQHFEYVVSQSECKSQRSVVPKLLLFTNIPNFFPKRRDTAMSKSTECGTNVLIWPTVILVRHCIGSCCVPMFQSTIVGSGCLVVPKSPVWGLSWSVADSSRSFLWSSNVSDCWNLLSLFSD